VSVVSKDSFGEFRSPRLISSGAINYYAEMSGRPERVPDDPPISLDEAPIVSFIIATRNRRPFLSETISSILRLNYAQTELVIVDDASTDDTSEYAAELVRTAPTRIIYRQSERQGPGRNRRAAWDEITGAYVVFIDDDDFYVAKNFVQNSIRIFEANAGLACVLYNSLILHDEDQSVVIDNPLGPVGRVDRTEYLASFGKTIRKPISTFPAMFSTSAMRDAGIETMKTLNDTQIYLRALIGGDAFFCEDYVGVYRVHRGSIGQSLSAGFIIENLDEKVRLADSLPPEIAVDPWLREQLAQTLRYYCESSARIDYTAIFRWLWQTRPIPRMYLTRAVAGWRLRKRLRIRGAAFSAKRAVSKVFLGPPSRRRATVRE